LLAQGAQERYGTPGLDAHTAPAGPFRHTFNPYVSPFAAHAKILHFNGDVRERRPFNFVKTTRRGDGVAAGVQLFPSTHRSKGAS
jgi:hypothetical protein